MPELIVEQITNRSTWNNALQSLPYAHVLQTWEWGEFKRATTGWKPLRLLFKLDDHRAAAASLLVRRIGPLAVMYIPKGPALDYDDPITVDIVFEYLETLAPQGGSIWLKVDPDVVIATGIPGEDDDRPDRYGQEFVRTLKGRGWRFSSDQVQFRNTIIFDLRQSEDELLASMSQNTRRKIRTASKKGVEIRPASIDDLPALYQLYRVTGERDRFLIRPAEYYEQAWRDFMQAGLAHALIAEVDGQAIAHVILFHFGQKCWYFYGASANDHREKMPNYLLQWEAIRWAHAQGYDYYDMWGAPDEFIETDAMWGVYEFKRGFRGTVTRYAGAWDFVPNPLLYRTYTELWPHVLGLLRRRAAPVS
jgi:peptidoglycan pentaglycine glycine transferase (the first glycine)